MSVQLLSFLDDVTFPLGYDLGHGDSGDVADHGDDEGMNQQLWDQLQMRHGWLWESGEKQ